jgi:hypothetical protein
VGSMDLKDVKVGVFCPGVPSNKRMKTTFFKVATLLIVLPGLSIFYIPTGAQAQANKTPVLTTNWVGYLVIGEQDSGDPIAGHRPFPKADQKIQMGLRSDGVVIWRRSRE